MSGHLAWSAGSWLSKGIKALRVCFLKDVLNQLHTDLLFMIENFAYGEYVAFSRIIIYLKDLKLYKAYVSNKLASSNTDLFPIL